MVPVARRNLLAERGRLAMSVAGVAFAVLLVLIILSLYRGWGGASGVFEELPGDVWVAQAGTTDPFRAASYLPADELGTIAGVEGVEAVLPVYARRVGFTYDGKDLDVFFLGLETPAGLAPQDEASAQFFPSEGQVVLDSVTAGDAGLAVGDMVTILGDELVVERIRAGGNPLFQVAFLNGVDAEEILGLDGYVNFFLVTVAAGSDVGEVEAAVAAAVPGSETRTSAEFAAAMSNLVDQGFLPVVGVLVAIGLVIGGAVIALTTYTATIERARDFGVLKAVGASNGFVYRIVVEQSFIVGALGAALGVVAAALAATLIKRGVPEFVTDLGWVDATWVFFAALGVSIAAAYVPVRRINRIDPAMVFRA